MIVALTLLGVSELLAFGLICQVLFHPGWEYRQAHRSKVLWLLAGIVALVLPLGYVFLVLGIIRGKAAARTDQAYYNAWRQRRYERQAMQSALQAELLISRSGRILKYCSYAAMLLSLYRFKSEGAVPVA
jgi:hypothetical protein